MQIPLVDLRLQYNSIKKEIDRAIANVLEKGQFILGENVRALEEEIANYCQIKYAVGVASGTDALILSLKAEDIGEGDEVITTPFTFIATAEAISQAGASPVFVDIDPKTYDIDPKKIDEFIKKNTSAQKHQSTRAPEHKSRKAPRRGKPEHKSTSQLINQLTGRRISAIIPVHLYGQMAEMKSILKIARRYKLKVIEDSAQALGAEQRVTGTSQANCRGLIHQARSYQPSAISHQSPITNHRLPTTDYRSPTTSFKAGSLGNIGCFSFFPSKNLGAYGDGGMIVTNSKKIADKVKMLRVHGGRSKYYHPLLGYNSRLDEIQAAILRVKLRHLDAWNEMRRRNALIYNSQLSTLGSQLSAPFEEEFNQHIYHSYVIRLRERDKLREYLKEKGISTQVYYPLPLHLQKVYQSLNYKRGSFPEAEKASKEVLSLPMYPELSKEQIKRIVSCIRAKLH